MLPKPTSMLALISVGCGPAGLLRLTATTGWGATVAVFTGLAREAALAVVFVFFIGDFQFQFGFMGRPAVQSAGPPPGNRPGQRGILRIFPRLSPPLSVCLDARERFDRTSGWPGTGVALDHGVHLPARAIAALGASALTRPRLRSRMQASLRFAPRAISCDRPPNKR